MYAHVPIVSASRHNPGVMIGFDEMTSFLAFLAKVRASDEAERIVQHPPLHIRKAACLKEG